MSPHHAWLVTRTGALLLSASLLGCPSQEEPQPDTCPEGAPGPAMVRLDPDGYRSFCIDATEVTQAQYEVFLSDHGADPSDAPEPCDWNATLAPNTGLGTCTAASYDPAGHPDHPVVCVDWCDAFAYCEWAGKRLCGDLTGGAIDRALDALDAGTSQWHNACTGGGQTVYPYGDSYEPEACNGEDAGHDATVPVASLAGCHGEGQFAEVFDLSGNVSEWEDACEYEDFYGSMYCPIRGGSFSSPSMTSALECGGGIESLSIDMSGNHSIGFRCCADLPVSTLAD